MIQLKLKNKSTGTIWYSPSAKEIRASLKHDGGGGWTVECPLSNRGNTLRQYKQLIVMILRGVAK